MAPEMLPPDSFGQSVEDLPHTAKVAQVRLWYANLSTKAHITLSIIGLAALFAPGAFFISQFTQARPPFGLAYSRLMLVGLGIVVFLMLWLISGRLLKRPLWTGIGSASLAMLLMIALDVWAPKPLKTTLQNSVPDVPPSATSPSDTTDRRSHGSATLTMPRDGWMKEWGSIPGGLRVVARVAPLIPYRLHLHLMLVCSIQDKIADQMEDVRIEKSAMFSVTNDDLLAMEMPLSQQFMKRTFPSKMVDVSLVLLPNPANSDQISKRSDIDRAGGSLLVTNAFMLQVQQGVLAK